jgi:hypothetical protein
MKKIYLSIIATAFAFTVNAQLVLTKAAYEAVVGDIYTKKGYDSTAVIPKSAGTGQNWNFSTLTSNTITEVSTWTTSASTPSASIFPAATIAEGTGSGGYNYWKSTASTFELLGFADAAGSAVTFTNSGIAATWPIAFGYSGMDAFAGTATLSGLAGTSNGTINATAPGSGTVTLPGSTAFSNCLQVKMMIDLNMNLGSFPVTFTVNQKTTEYHYYHSSQKFEIITVAYNTQTVSSSFGSPTVTANTDIRINNAVIMGINDVNFDAINYNVYPNPATDNVNINLTNGSSDHVSIVVINNLGQVVKSADLGNSMDVKHSLNTSDLPKGMYHITTSIGDRSTTKKLIIQ